MSTGDVELRQIKELIELMDRHGLLEVELFEEGRKIRLKKAPAPVVAHGVSPEVLAIPVPGFESTAPAVPTGIVEIHSPMVGSFYRAPSPDADFLIEEGDKVTEGDVLCIIEAMKVMNEIKAEAAGTIERVVVENGQAVEYGEVLFHLRPE